MAYHLDIFMSGKKMELNGLNVYKLKLHCSVN